MSEYPSVQRMVDTRSPAITAIVAPTHRAAAPTDMQLSLPPPDNWRMRQEDRIGLVLDGVANVLRSNHFKIDPHSIPSFIYLYHVSIYRYERDNMTLQQDKDGKDFNLASDTKDTDVLQTYAIMRALRAMHPEWEVERRDNTDAGSWAEGREPDNLYRPGTRIGLTYDGRSALFATTKLDFTAAAQVRTPSRRRSSSGGSGSSASASASVSAPGSPTDTAMEEGEPMSLSMASMSSGEAATDGEIPGSCSDDGLRFEQDVTVPDSNAVYRVTLLETNAVSYPHHDEPEGWKDIKFEALRALDTAVLGFARWETGKNC
jgi:hypothetical protein